MFTSENAIQIGNVGLVVSCVMNLQTREKIELQMLQSTGQITAFSII